MKRDRLALYLAAAAILGSCLRPLPPVQVSAPTLDPTLQPKPDPRSDQSKDPAPNPPSAVPPTEPDPNPSNVEKGPPALVTPDPPLTRSPKSEPKGPPDPIRLRVGLATDLSEVSIPCCAAAPAIAVEGKWRPLAGPLTVRPAPESTHAGFYRLQVAALRDEGQARSLAQRLQELTGLSTGAVFDAALGLYRVRLGRFQTRDIAETHLRALAARGLSEAWVVGEGGEIRDPALEISSAGHSFRLSGRWARVTARGGSGVRFNGATYRGDLLVFLNDRGTLNAVNELELENYLRGVVPGEMGPSLYGRLEALKAQAVAARTYALRHLGEFSREGYDICATPRCQVYLGMGAEHPLTDRAISETELQVLLYRDRLIDARYSASCGGHTEDSGVVFPLDDAPYLRGMPCPESGLQSIAGGLARGTAFPEGLTRKLLPADPRSGPGQALEERLHRLGELAGLALARDRLHSLDRAEIRRFVASLFDLALDPESLDRIGLPADPGPAGPREIENLLLALARELGVIRELEVRFLSAADGTLTVRSGAGVRRYPLSADLATFRRHGERLAAGDLALAPGDGLRLVLQGERPVGLAQAAAPAVSRVERNERYFSWRRFKTDTELAAQVRDRYPGLDFLGFEILARGVSGRVGKLRLLGAGERNVDVEGLAVRWTLDLPDTRFQARRTVGAGGRQGWLFTGSGWGHGVGMCQYGAFAMAGRGGTYRDILEYFYSGVTLARVQASNWRRPV